MACGSRGRAFLQRCEVTVWNVSHLMLFAKFLQLDAVLCEQPLRPPWSRFLRARLRVRGHAQSEGFHARCQLEIDTRVPLPSAFQEAVQRSALTFATARLKDEEWLPLLFIFAFPRQLTGLGFITVIYAALSHISCHFQWSWCLFFFVLLTLWGFSRDKVIHHRPVTP